MVYFLPVLLWSLLIWCLSTNSGMPPIPFDFLSPDKVGHLVFYAIETLLWIWAFAKLQQWQASNYFWIFVSVLLASAYGTSLEFVQATLPHRSFDYADMLANFAGIFIGIMIYCRKQTYFFKRSEN